MTRTKSTYLALLAVLLSPMAANATIIQVDFSGMNQGPYTIEDFESTFDPGATYSADSGVQTFSGDGFNRGPGNGLTTNLFPEEIFIDFLNPVTSAGYWFGNDDTCCSDPFIALMDIFTVDGYLTSISIEANMNGMNDQFLGFIGDEFITRISIQYLVNDELTGHFHAIDDVMWNAAAVPEPVTIDIKPGSDPVCNGATRVAILGSVTLDVIQIDQTTLSFEGLNVRERGNGALSCNIRDTNRDGFADLVCQYQDTTTEGTLIGELLDGSHIEGTDTFCVVH